MKLLFLKLLIAISNVLILYIALKKSAILTRAFLFSIIFIVPGMQNDGTGIILLVHGILGAFAMLFPILYFVFAKSVKHTLIAYFLSLSLLLWGFYNYTQYTDLYIPIW